MKYLFVLLLIICNSLAYAQTKSEKIDMLVVETTNKSLATINSNNNGVVVYKSEAIGSMVVNHRQEMIKSNQYLNETKAGYIDAYQQAGCTFFKPLIEQGVILKIITYDKKGGLAFSFIVKCE